MKGDKSELDGNYEEIDGEKPKGTSYNKNVNCSKTLKIDPNIFIKDINANTTFKIDHFVDLKNIEKQNADAKTNNNSNNVNWNSINTNNASKELDEQAIDDKFKLCNKLPSNSSQELSSSTQDVFSSTENSKCHINNHTNENLSTKGPLHGSRETNNKVLDQEAINELNVTAADKREEPISLLGNLSRIQKVIVHFQSFSFTRKKNKQLV